MPVSRFLLGFLVLLLGILEGHELYAQETSPLQLRFSDSQNPQAKELKVLLETSSELEASLTFIQETFVLKPALSIVFGDQNGPRWNRAKQTIDFPYDFLLEARQRFLKNGFQEGPDLQDALLSVLTYALYHELGVALIDRYALRVPEPEGAAAKGLALVLLLETVEDGAFMILTTSELLFLLEEGAPGASGSFLKRHHLNEQRYQELLCHVYGSSPGTHADLVGVGGLPPASAGKCEERYQQLKALWFRLLEPHLLSEENP